MGNSSLFPLFIVRPQALENHCRCNCGELRRVFDFDVRRPAGCRRISVDAAANVYFADSAVVLRLDAKTGLSPGRQGTAFAVQGQ